MWTWDTELSVIILLGQHLYQEIIFLPTVSVITTYNSPKTCFVPPGAKALIYQHQGLSRVVFLVASAFRLFYPCLFAQMPIEKDISEMADSWLLLTGFNYMELIFLPLFKRQISSNSLSCMDNCHHSPFLCESFLMSYKTHAWGTGFIPMAGWKCWCGTLFSSCCSAVGEGEFQRTALPLAFMQSGSNPVVTSNHTLTGTVMALQRTEERHFGVTTSIRGYT